MKCFSTELAYLLGVYHSDGTIVRYKFKNVFRHRFVLTCAENSLGMLEKTRDIFFKLFQRKVSIMKRSTLSCQGGSQLFTVEVQIAKLWPVLKKFGFNSGRIPIWIAKNPNYFGAYLAALIDGDGNVVIKRPQYPQCCIRITSAKELRTLRRLIKRHLKCACHTVKITRFITSLPRAKPALYSWWQLSFLASPKNAEFLKAHVLEFMALPYKRDKINSFLKVKM